MMISSTTVKQISNVRREHIIYLRQILCWAYTVVVDADDGERLVILVVYFRTRTPRDDGTATRTALSRLHLISLFTGLINWVWLI